MSDLALMEVDLLARVELGRGVGTAAAEAARALAVAKFLDQLAKAGLSVSSVASATLVVERLGAATALVDWHERAGFSVRFRVTATADTGRVFAHEETVFVAPHDARLERRSSRA